MEHPRPYHYEDPRDSTNSITVSAGEGGARISVSDEKAVDSYNADFECEIVLTISEALKLRDYLIAALANN